MIEEGLRPSDFKDYQTFPASAEEEPARWGCARLLVVAAVGGLIVSTRVLARTWLAPPPLEEALAARNLCHDYEGDVCPFAALSHLDIVCDTRTVDDIMRPLKSWVPPGKHCDAYCDVCFPSPDCRLLARDGPEAVAALRDLDALCAARKRV